MSDIFRLIRANIERTRKDDNVRETNMVKKSNKMDGINLDSFIIGEDEKKFQNPNPKKSKSIELEKTDILEQEIGEDFESKDYLADIEQIDYLKLDKMPKEKQLRLLKKEYLVLLDRIKEVSNEFTKVDKKFKEQSVEFHNMQTTISKLKEFVRIIGTMIPDGMELKTKLEAPSWSIDDIEDEMISRLNFVINRAKNADDYVEQETLDLSNQIQGLKNKLTKVENHNLELEQEIDKLYEQLENASFPEEEDGNDLTEESYTDADEYSEAYEDSYDESGNEYFNISEDFSASKPSSNTRQNIYQENDDEDEYEEHEEYETYDDTETNDNYDDKESFDVGKFENQKSESKDDFDDLYNQEYGDFFDDEVEEAVERPKRFQTRPSPNRNSRTQNERTSSNQRNTREKTNPPSQNPSTPKPTRRPEGNERPVRKEQPKKETPTQPTRNQNSSSRSEQNTTRSQNQQRREQTSPSKKQERPTSNRQTREVDTQRPTTKPARPDTSNQRPSSSKPNERPSRQTPKNDDKKQTHERPQRQERPTSNRPQRNRPSRPEPMEEELLPNNARERDDTYDPTQAIDVDPYLESLTEDAKFIIKMIGEVGVSRNAELKDLLSEREDAKPLFFHGTKFQKNNMNNAVNDLINAQILTNDQIKLGSRGGIFKIYELTDLGKHIYFALTNEVPVKSELALLIRQHASAEHGFLIKDSAAIFKEMGYTVHTERKDLRRDVSDGKHKSFDLIIEKGDETCYIEVERGTHNDEDFYKAMDKIREVTQQFYFICPNEDILFSKTKRQFFLWVQKHLGGMDQAKGIQANFTTFGKLKEGKKPLWDDINL
ncbi:hypothetical protein CN918_27325 [Priestia megaterium]|nr:hypothetical protein CN918_27325 [Priestia megaterium]